MLRKMTNRNTRDDHTSDSDGCRRLSVCLEWVGLVWLGEGMLTKQKLSIDHVAGSVSLCAVERLATSDPAGTGSQAEDAQCRLRSASWIQASGQVQAESRCVTAPERSGIHLQGTPSTEQKFGQSTPNTHTETRIRLRDSSPSSSHPSIFHLTRSYTVIHNGFDVSTRCLGLPHSDSCYRTSNSIDPSHILFRARKARD